MRCRGCREGNVFGRRLVTGDSTRLWNDFRSAKTQYAAQQQLWCRSQIMPHKDCVTVSVCVHVLMDCTLPWVTSRETWENCTALFIEWISLLWERFTLLCFCPILVSFNRQKGIIFDLKWSPNGEKLCAVSDDRTVTIWSVTNLSASNELRCVCTLYGHQVGSGHFTSQSLWMPLNMRVFVAFLQISKHSLVRQSRNMDASCPLYYHPKLRHFSARKQKCV